MDDFVPENAIDYQAVFDRGGRNCGDEDFALQVPWMQVYLLEYKVDTVYLDGRDLARRCAVFDESFHCVRCGKSIPDDGPWAGPNAETRFRVTWEELARSDWAWIVDRLL